MSFTPRSPPADHWALLSGLPTYVAETGLVSVCLSFELPSSCSVILNKSHTTFWREPRVLNSVCAARLFRHHDRVIRQHRECDATFLCFSPENITFIKIWGARSKNPNKFPFVNLSGVGPQHWTSQPCSARQPSRLHAGSAASRHSTERRREQTHRGTVWLLRNLHCKISKLLSWPLLKLKVVCYGRFHLSSLS